MVLLENHKINSGCGAVRLAYTAGGRVVAGSNPVIPTKYHFKLLKKRGLLISLFIYPPYYPPNSNYFVSLS